ncbi:MAG TPA: SprT family zinc-dependent metalloprotease, partial [Candidatus Cloacimonadota bacterium]|nr:SprT family zinc-dependent metalloprotease [Candidatus Cloacimonadota bacterium]
DLSIEFRGNVSITWENITSVLDKKALLIRKKRHYFEQFFPLPVEHRYESGETFYYLGRQYRLKKVESTHNRVRLLGKWFIVELTDINNKERVRKLMHGWYRKQAVRRISERFRVYYQQFENTLEEEPVLTFRKMQKRWGSCTGNRILFNTELIKTPMVCIDYIIVHELCHIFHPKHNTGFYRKLSRVMPDWQQRKARLEFSVI